MSVKHVSLALLAGAAWVGATAVAVTGQTTAPPSVRAGAYTEEQSMRGQMLYAEYCSECHGETLAGLEQALPLAGPQFTGVWDGEPLSALVTRISEMPPDEISGLTRAQNVDILAYMLHYNGLPAGKTPLSTQQSVLTKMLFEAPLPPGK
jgi:mono/diheme cytochrome c family protein